MTHRSNATVAARTLLLQFAAVAALVAGCGGGGDSGMTGQAAGRSYATGSIDGFGSIIVNGVRFDNSTAATTDDDNNPAAASALQLGMQVEVTGGRITDDGQGHRLAHAIAVRFGNQVVGPVSAVDAVAKTLVVLGQNVNVLDTTVMDASLVGGLAAVNNGTVLAVFGTRDATTGTINATRIQPSTLPIYRVKGRITSLDTVGHTFMIGGALIDYTNANPVPASLVNGMAVAARLQTTQGVNGAWIANAVINGRPLIPDSDDADVDGIVSSFTSTSAFEVNGIPVDATNAQFPQGTAGIVLGAHVEVKGSASAGVLTATEVDVETEATDRARGFELHGAITTIDTTAKTFVLRGLTVDYSGTSVVYQGGTAAQLAVGAQVEVKGVLAPDGTTLKALLIVFGG
jgi:hypothetical protein